MDSTEYRKAAKAAVDGIADYLDNVASHRVVSAVEPGYLRPQLPASAPEEAEPWSAIEEDIRTRILPGITHWSSPRFMAFFSCSGSFPAAVADMWSGAFNGAHFNWVCSPAVTELETVVMDWMARAIALPECFLSGGTTGGGGVIQTTASEALLTAMVAARDRYLADVMGERKYTDVDLSTTTTASELDDDEMFWTRRNRLVAVGSAAAHSSTAKAARILGVRWASVPVSCDSQWAMTGESLASTLEDLDARGFEPFYVTATMGTTDVCAVDDMEGIARVLEERDARLNLKTAQGESSDDEKKEKQKRHRGRVWVHVDAAWAGTALLLPSNQHLAAAFARFDSFNFNPHKWMLTTFDCSALWVRRRGDLIEALSVKPAYLRNRYSDQPHHGGQLVTDYRDWQIPLGRRFRSLKLWAVLRSYGLAGLRAHVAGGVARAERLQGSLESRPDLFSVFTAARFALVTFQVVGSSGGGDGLGKEEEVNGRTERLYDAVQATGDFFLTSTVVAGHFAIRVCTGVERMRDEHVQQLFDLFVRLTEDIVKG